MRTLKKTMVFVALIVGVCSCKSDFLDAKPQKSLMIPSTLIDLEALLNNSRSIFNRAGYLSLAADGDFRISDNYLSFVNDPIRFNYTWTDETTNWIGDWDYAYEQIFYSNVVLQGLDRLSGEYDKVKANELRGRALFYRAWALHLTAEQFAGVYDKEMAANTMGIPCPISPDVNKIVERSTLQENYDKIFADLNEALTLLPDKSTLITQPSRAGVFALLSRLYLITGDYHRALEAADNSLAINESLLNYNEISTERAVSFSIPTISANPEILYYTIGNTAFTSNINTFADSSLYKLYLDYDLRKVLFFTASLNYKGSYTGGTTPFVGLTTAEVYLIKAESLARLAETKDALNTLNVLRSKRYSVEGFTNVKKENGEDLLKLILLERRKEMVGRGTTWMDLRRLNKESEYERTITRQIGGMIYTLKPGDKRYVMKIPTDEIALSGIEQNP